jgi:hypothetical protein
MKQTTLTVGSVTYAIKAKKALLGIGIKSKLIKVTSSSKNLGCEYGIEFPSVYFLDAVAELKKQKINYTLYNNEKA